MKPINWEVYDYSPRYNKRAKYHTKDTVSYLDLRMIDNIDNNDVLVSILTFNKVTDYRKFVGILLHRDNILEVDDVCLNVIHNRPLDTDYCQELSQDEYDRRMVQMEIEHLFRHATVLSNGLSLYFKDSPKIAGIYRNTMMDLREDMLYQLENNWQGMEE